MCSYHSNLPTALSYNCWSSLRNVEFLDLATLFATVSRDGRLSVLSSSTLETVHDLNNNNNNYHNSTL